MPDITKKTTGMGSARKKALEETKKRLEAKKSIAEAFQADGYTPDKPNTYVRDVKVGTTPIIGAGQYADSTGKRNQFSFSEQQRRANEQTARTNYMTAAQQKAASTADKAVPSMAFHMLLKMLSKPSTFAQSGSARKDINQWYGDNTRTNNGFQSFSKPDTLYKARQTTLTAPEVLTENERKAREGYLSLTAKTDAFGNLIGKRTDINSLRESVSAPIQTREEDQKQNKAADYMDERALAAQQKAAIKEAQAVRSPEEQIVRFLGGTGRAAQRSVYNYGSNILNTIDALNHKTDQMYGMSGTKIERDKLDKAFKGISDRVQQDIDNGNISAQWAQTVDTAVRMGIDATVTAATAGLFSGAAAATSGNRIANAVLDAVQNPAFYTSYVQEFGSDYADYVSNGVDEDKAVLIAGTIALLNSYVEVQGGTEKSINSVVDRITQKIPKSAPFDTFKEIFTNSLEEALEEIIQAPIGNLGTKLAYNPDQVVFDPVEQLSNGWSAFISSLILGGATTGIEYGVNRNWKNQDISSQYAYIGQQVKKDNKTLSDLLTQAETSNSVSARFQSYTIQQTLSNGETPSDYKVGQLAASMAEAEQIDAERQKIVGERQAKQEQKRQKKNQSQQTEETPVQQETDNVISAPLDEEVMPESGTETEPSAHIETDSQTARADENTASVQAVQEPETQAASKESASVTHSVATPVATPETQEQPLEISARELNSYGENGQRALRAGLTRAAQSGESQTAYKNAFTAYYKWGTWGKDISQIDSAFSGSISQSAAYAAYMSGVNDNASIVARNTANQRKATGAGGLMQGTHNSKVDANTRNYLDAVGRAFRVSIAIDDEGSGYNGMLDKNGVVHVAADTTRPAAGVLNHELTHVLRSRSESDYQTYKNVVAAFINKESEGAFEQRVEELIDLYAENDQTLTRDEAEEEIVANASEMFLRDKESVNLMVKQNRGVAKKILDGIRAIINKLKGIVRDGRIHNKEAQILSRDMEAFQKAERLWVSALSGSTGEMNEEVSVNEKTASTKEAGTIKYQIVEDEGGNSLVLVENQLKTKEDIRKAVIQYIRNLAESKAKYTLFSDNNLVYIGNKLPTEYTYSVSSKRLRSKDRPGFNAKMQAIQNIGEIIEISQLTHWRKNAKEKHAHDAKYGWYYADTRFGVKDESGKYKMYSAELVIRHGEDNRRYLYDVQKIKQQGYFTSASMASDTAAKSDRLDFPETAVSNVNISEQWNNVNSQNAQTKEKFSLKETDWHTAMTEEETSEYNRKNINPNGGSPYYNDRSYRGYSKNGALSAYGHAMFADDPDSISGYSGRDDARDRGFYTVMHSDLESIDNLKAAIAEAWDEDAENGMTPSGYEDVTGEEIAEQFDPEDIVDSAGAWDNGELISWAFDRGLFDDISGVKTYDGAVAWDQSIIHRANEDSDEGVIGEIKDEKLQLREDNPYDWLDDGDEDYSDEGTAPTPGDEDAPPETVIKEDLGGDWLDRQVDRTISSNENVESTVAAIRAEGRAFKDVKPDAVAKVVKAAAKQYGTADTAQLNTAVHGALDYLARHGEEGTESAVASVYQAVKSALSKAESVDRTMYDETKGMRDYLKTTRIYVPDSVKSDITDYNDFRKSLFGKVRIVNDPTAMHIDQAYAELSAQYPGLLSSGIINPSAQLQEIADTLDAAQPVIVASYGEDGQTSFIGNINEASIDMTTDILHSLAQTAITQAKDADTREKLAAQRKWFGEQKKKLRQELRNKYKTELISQQTEAKAQAALAQTNFGIEMAQKQKELNSVQAQLKQAEKNLAKTKKQAEKDALKARMTDYRNRMNALNKWLDEHHARQRDAAKAQERIAAIREANRLAKEKAADKRAIAKRRQSVEKITTRLYRKLSKPTDTQHIPQGFRVSVANFLSSLDFEGRDKAGNVKDTKVNDAWRELAQECRRIAGAEASNADSTYLTIDPDLADRLDELSKTPVRSMNKEQIEELYKAARAIEKAVTDADRVRVNGQMQQATEVARGIIKENRSKAKETRRILSGLQGMEKFFKYDLLDPTRFADMWGDGFKTVYSDLRSAELEKIRLWAQFEKDTEKMMGNSGYSKKKAWKSEKTIHKVTLDSGKHIELSSAQIMEIYLLNNREQGRSHLYGGGITPDSIKNRGVVTENRASYRLTEQDVKKMIELLSEDEKKMADQMGQYASTTMSGWGNKASMELYGYKKFTESNYWPISTDSAWTHSDVSAETAGRTGDSASIKNLGMTKAVVQNASNPIMVGSVFDTFSKHATQMAAYSAYLNPIENLNKVLNWQTRHDGNWRSVRESIRMVGGQNAISYLNTFIRDVNGQVRTEQNPYSQLMGKAKAAAIAGNLRVVVQQPTAWGRAAAIIPPQYMIGGLVGKVDTGKMRQYAPIAQWKDWGYFRDGTTGANMKQLMLGKNSVADNVTDKAMALAGIMDDVTWKRLYKSVELWVAHDMGENRSEAYRQEVGRRFTDVIDRTQVVDSVFERTQAMRSTNYGWQIATAFMAEPLKTYNLLVGTARGIANAEKGAKGAAAKVFIKAAIGFGIQAVLNAAAQSLWDIGRDKDDDETWQEKFLQAMFGDEVVDAVRTGEPLSGTPTEIVSAALGGNLQGSLNVLNLIPVFKDVMSWLDGYDTELLGISDVKSIIEMGGSLYKSMTGDPQKKTTSYQAIQLFRKISSVTGLPIGNIYREVESGVNLATTLYAQYGGDSKKATELRFRFDKYYLTGSENRKIYYSLIYKARQEGNDELAMEIANWMIDQGVTRKSIDTALQKMINDDAENSDLINEYADAYNSGDITKMSSIIDKAKKRGISGDELQTSAKKLLNTSSGSEDDEEEKDYYTDGFGGDAEYDNTYLYDQLANDLLSGNKSGAEKITAELKNSGKEQKDIDSGVKSKIKARMLKDAGYESQEDMEAAGGEFDVDSKEYKYLHDTYSWTQYNSHSLADAALAGDSEKISRILKDAVGQTNTSGNVWTEESLRESAIRYSLQSEFNEIYENGSGDESKWRPYVKAMQALGKSWDDILKSYHKSTAYKEITGKK